MRFLLAALAVLLIPAAAQAQTYRAPDIAAQRAAMERLAPLLGHWQGEAQLRQPQAMTVHQTEQVELALDGIAMLVRGTGHATAERSGAPVFQASYGGSKGRRSQLSALEEYGKLVAQDVNRLFRTGEHPKPRIQQREP